MSVSELIKNRYSVRGFLPKAVPSEVIREVIEIAGRAPSGSNTQPWHITIVSGAALEKLKQSIADFRAGGGVPEPDVSSTGGGAEGVYKERQQESGRAYYEMMGVGREDSEARQKLVARNWQFFDAPHAGFLSMPRNIYPSNAVDMGIFFQSLMLLFAERGIATCPQGSLACFPNHVREVAHVPEGNVVLCGLSFGYEAPDALANKLRTEREKPDNIASFAE